MENSETRYVKFGLVIEIEVENRSLPQKGRTG
jgi:hypothetical protein